MIGLNKIIKTSSVKTDIFISCMFYTAVLLFTVGIFTSKLLYNSEISKVSEVIEQRNLAINYTLEGHFSEVANTVKVLSKLSILADAKEDSAEVRQRLLAYFKQVHEDNPKIEYLYAGFNNNSLLINNYQLPVNINVVDRPWYVSIMNNAPNVSTGQPYRDAADGSWLISTGVSFEDRNGETAGVVSIDTKLSDLNKQLSARLT